MKTILLKILNWLFKKFDRKSHFIILSQNQNRTYIFIDGKEKLPVNYYSGKSLTTLELNKLNSILSDYFKLIDKK